ncbi:MAG: hypothetical protein ACOCXQ_03620 [Patescibacteria group bacterium]
MKVSRGLPIIVLLMLITLFSGCVSSEELNADIEAQYVIVGYNDYYTSDQSKSFIRMNARVSTEVNPEGGYTRATGSNDGNIQAAGIPMGKLIGFDEGTNFGSSYEELKVLGPNNETVIQLSQTEAGYIENEENLQVVYQGETIAQLFEREQMGTDSEQESIEVLTDGEWRGVASVTEHGNPLARETLRSGTKVVDHREDEWTFETSMGKSGMFMPAGSTISINGDTTLTVETRVLEKAFGRKVFDGFSINDQNGRELCGYVINDELSTLSYAYEFSCGNDKLGTLFVHVRTATVYSRPNGEGCHSDDGCTETTTRVSYRLEGTTMQEKIENLKVIDYIMALMPDQVNKNHNHLHELEELSDVVLILLLNPEGEEAAKYGISLATEEDALSLHEAYVYVIEEYGESAR